MEQRPLRLGDIVDDYCPRERRITNHVIVALVGEAIRQTRCGTCDTEHVYKAARLPRKRLKEDGEDAAPGQLVARPAPEAVVPAPMAAPPPETPRPAPVAAAAATTNGASPAPPDLGQPSADRADDIWPAHRRLIRAQLPRVEGEQKEPRPIPEFTMHQRQGRGGNPYRGDHFGNGNGNGNANGNGGGGFRHGQPGGGHRRDQGGGGQPGAGGGGGKRWRHRRRGRGGPNGPKAN